MGFETNEVEILQLFYGEDEPGENEMEIVQLISGF